MAETIPQPEMESQKRRSTRIVQAVPLTVTGVDALGRPFQERTSTLIINCHGCRYQSKHYVLKNMWVSFEVPHNEPGHEVRRVRARVSWIQRPRTVRELFQIGVELEVHGNVWGIAFPPADWFPFPETLPEPEVSEESQPAGVSGGVAEWISDGTPESPQPELVEDNLRVLPLPGGADPQLQLARQVARLVTEAKQQVQGAVREAASQSVAAETRPFISALQGQLKDAAEKFAESAVAAQMERIEREGLARVESERRARLETLRAEFSQELDRRIAEALSQIDKQLAEFERTRRTDFEQQIESQLSAVNEKLRSLISDLSADAGKAQTVLEQARRASEEAAGEQLRRWQGLIDHRASDAQSRLAHLEQAAKRMSDQIDTATSAAGARWRGLLEADLAAAGSRWNEKIETSLEAAARQAAERFSRIADTSARQMEGQIQQRVAAGASSLAQAAVEAESTLGNLRAAVDQESARGRAAVSEVQQSLEARRKELFSVADSAASEIARRGEALLDAHTREINRRAELAAEAMTRRVQPLLETSGRQTIERLAGELEQRLAPQITRTTEILSKLAFDQSQAEKALAEHQNRVWQVSERSVQESVARAKEILAAVEKEFAESARNATSKWLAELDAKSTETTHSTFEALFKSAEWYEKKVQTQMQATLEKGLDQAAGALRDKAGEISGLFASELDHYSRSYVEHAQSQMEENARDAAEKAALQMAQAADAASQNFSDRAGELGRRQVEQFSQKADSVFEQNAARFEAHTTQVRSKLESDARALAGEFQRMLSQQTQQSLMQGKQELSSQVDLAKDSLRIEAQSLDRQLHTSLQALGAHAMDQYKERLENASNSWLLTTVTKLNQRSDALIDQLAEATEKRLRSVCNQVFTEIGDTLRQRLAGVSVPPTVPHVPAKPPESKTGNQP